MPRDPRLTANDAAELLQRAGFDLLRMRGSHRIYGKGTIRVVVPFHGDEPLHPKIVRQILKAIADSLRARP